MTVNIEGQKILKQKEINKSTNVECSFIGLVDQIESEIKWVELHQMFDR
tara:strand:- start:108 stop:254 length:147 start_codon:yes stop_codon:yes gene_type:complete